MTPIVACFDVGSVRQGPDKSRFGWAAYVEGEGKRTGRWPEDLVETLSKAGETYSDRPLALGMEAPIWVPVPNEAENLGRGRDREGSSAWSSPYGGGSWVTANGLTQLPYVLAGVASRWRVATTDTQAYTTSNDPTLVLLWEAFVAGTGKPGWWATDADDAWHACEAFRQRFRGSNLASDVEPRHYETVFNLALAAATAAGLETIGSATSTPMVVRTGPG